MRLNSPLVAALRVATGLLLGSLAAVVPVRAAPSGTAGAAAASADSTGGVVAPELRTRVVRVLLAPAADQPALIEDLSATGSRFVSDVLTSWSRGEIYLLDGPRGSHIPVILDDQQDADGKARAIQVGDGRFYTDGGGKVPYLDPTDLTSVDADMRLRSIIQRALDVIALADPDPNARMAAVAKLGGSQKALYVPALKARLALETSAPMRRAIEEAVALIGLADPSASVQVQSADRLRELEALGSIDALTRLASKSPDPAVVQAAAAAVRAINRHIQAVNFYGTIFRGISLGSILLIVALGLAITFGLMGIINMAHGEMIAVGAYTCYVVQNVFGSGFVSTVTLPFSFGGHPIAFSIHLPGMNATGRFYESYFLFAIPLSFLAAAAMGLLVERTIIRFLYRRPLESLLATWGVSLVLQQVFRMVFGANNVQVSSPSWLLGHFELGDVSFGYNRVFVICFAVAIVAGTWLLLSRTSLGLLIRAVMQNRDMASCMGIRTGRVNRMTFAFGSGLAGLAGAFLSQIGNVGPNLGQSYIVDSFMTVVVGGVGSIVGTVVAAFGIGSSDQVLQQLMGSPVMGKIIVLGFIILFLQWKPGGLFAVRSRNLDG